MFLLSFAVVFMAISALAVLRVLFIRMRYATANCNDWDVSLIFFALSLAACVLATIFTMGYYTGQISAAEDLVKFERLEQIYEVRADALTEQFAAYLVDLYPEYEKSIFESISPDGIDLYLVKYPELRASETILALVAQIRSLQDDRYRQQVLREMTLKRMRFRTRNPWILNYFIPEVPER